MKDCPICTEPIKEPYIAVCKHEFCLQCILLWSNSLRVANNATSCPMCRHVIDHNDILCLHSKKFPAEDNNKILSVEDFIRLNGVKKIGYHANDYILDMKHSDWMNALDSVLRFKKIHNNIATIEKSILKVGDSNILFQTPKLLCLYIDGSSNRFQQTTFNAFSRDNTENDFAEFDMLDKIFMSRLAVDNNYKSLIKESPNAPNCITFKCEPATCNIFDSSGQPMDIKELKNRSKLMCCFLVRIVFVKVHGAIMHPIMTAIQVKCDNLPLVPLVNGLSEVDRFALLED